jgi:hypothetical protein
MADLELLLRDADLVTVLREGARTARVLMVVVEALRKVGAQLNKDDLELLRELSRESLLLWARANELRGGDTSPTSSLRIPARRAHLRVLRRSTDGGPTASPMLVRPGGESVT